MKTNIRLLSVLLLFTAAPVPAGDVVVPEYVNYQGLLKAADGSPLATGNYTIEFNVYDAANLGTKVWGPFLFDGGVGNGHGALVPVVTGGFNVIIGPKDEGGTSITSAFSGPNRFIEITVGGGDPILPRQQFLSTAYALQSQEAELAQLALKADIASDLVQQVADILCPPGTIVAFGGDIDPNAAPGTPGAAPTGWFLCDGRALKSSEHPRLFTAIGTAWGDGTYHQSLTETPADPATNFNVPDLRGMFLRGVNGSLADQWKDPEAVSRQKRYEGNIGNAVGSVQSGEFLSHNHTPEDPDAFRFLVRMGSIDTVRYSDDSGYELNLKSAGVMLDRGGLETRPNNTYVHYIIKHGQVEEAP